MSRSGDLTGEAAAYRFATLAPSKIPAEQRDVLGPRTLGIEVTVPALAAACGLGNIDPQHTPGHGGGQAAIEAALVFPLPGPGNMLVTIRPDLDSIGAMAVLAMRADGEPIGSDAHARIDEIARADRHERGAWPGPRPIASVLAEPAPLAPLALAVSDATPSLARRVAMLRRWLADGDVPAEYRERATAEHGGLIEALRNRTFRMRALRGDRIALAIGERPEALKLAYCLSPVVIALNPAFRPGAGPGYRKFTIAQYRAGYADFGRLRDELTGREPGWGGSPTILGSPQGTASTLPFCAVVRAVRLALAPSAQIEIGQ